MEKSTKHEIVILGAGIAGLSVAIKFAEKKIKTTLIDLNNKPLAGASGNKRAVIMPYPTQGISTFSSFFANSFLHAVKFYQKYNSEKVIFIQNGVLRFANTHSLKKFSNRIIQDNLSELERELELSNLNSEAASRISNTNLIHPYLYCPIGGSLDTASFAQVILKTFNKYINFIPCLKIKKIQKIKEEIEIISNCKNHLLCQTLVISTAFDTINFSSMINNSVEQIKGQVTEISLQNNIKTVICSDGYMIPISENSVLLGASYDKKFTNLETSNEVSNQILNKQKLFSSILQDSEIKILKNRTGIRISSKDKMPIVGETQTPGIFLNLAHGSRGYTSAPLSAEILTSLILNQNLDPKLEPYLEALSPNRISSF